MSIFRTIPTRANLATMTKSERYEKFYRDRYEAQKDIKNVRSYGNLFPVNPNFGVTEN